MSAKSYEFGNWTLKEILTDERLEGALFLIPDYQRGYAWGRRQREEFWEDLLTLQRNDKSENAAENDSGKKGKSHYMGAITVECKKDEGGYPVYEVVDGQKHPVYEVVDGQQRLTTIAILLSVLGGHEFCSRFSYGESNENHDFLEKILDGSSPEPSNVYQKNLVEAKSFFSEKVNKLDSVGLSAKEIKTWVVGDSEEGHLEFDFRILRQDHNAGIIFETMNNRGKPLTLLEKLKNRLMYLTEIAAVEDESDDDENPIDANELRRTINEAWGNIYRALASDPKRDPLDEDEFVAAHLTVYRNPKESVYSETVAESRLFKMFCEHPEEHPISEEIDERQQDAVAGAEKEEPLSRGKIERYVKDLSRFAPAWAGLHQEFASACGQCRILSDRRETKIFLAAVALHVEDENLREKIYEAARLILFRNTIGAGMDRTRFATLARRLHDVCVDQLKRGQRKRLDGNGVLAELRAVLDNEKKMPTKTTLIEFFADKKGDFYGWSELGMRYFLMRHEEDYRGLDEKTPRRLTWEMFEKVSVEHVLPQSSATRNSRGWRWWSPLLCDWLHQIAGNDNPTPAELEAAAEMLSGTLGNLTLLTRKENSEVSNRPWDTYSTRSGKREFYLDSRNRSSNGAVELASTTEPKKWNAFHIRERGRKLFRQLADDFGVDSKQLSDSEVDRALGFTDPNDANHQVYHLEDLEIPSLGPDVIAANVHADEEEDQKEEGHRQWNAMPADEHKKAYLNFWMQFNEWCHKNNAGFACREADRNYVDFGHDQSGNYVLKLSIVPRDSLVRLEIYAENRNQDDKTNRQINEDTMNRLMQCQAVIEEELQKNSDTIECNWGAQRADAKARKALFCRPCDIARPKDDNFRLMVADARSLVTILRSRGEIIDEV